MTPETLAKDISGTLGMPTPRIERWDGWRSDADTERGVIRLRRDEANREDVVLHEVAHFAHYHFYLGPGIRGHGDGFCRSLVDVIQAAHKDPKLYPWHTEYRNVWIWAVKQGLTTEAYYYRDERPNGGWIPGGVYDGVVRRQEMLKARETIRVGDRVEWKGVVTGEDGAWKGWGEGTGVVKKISRTRFLVSPCRQGRLKVLGPCLVYARDIKKVESGS